MSAAQYRTSIAVTFTVLAVLFYSLNPGLNVVNVLLIIAAVASIMAVILVPRIRSVKHKRRSE